MAIIATVKSYGERFREMRDKAGLRQEVVAARLFSGRGKKAQSNVSQIENRRGKLPSIKKVINHARALGCQPSELVDGVNDLDFHRLLAGEFDTQNGSKDAKN